MVIPSSDTRGWTVPDEEARDAAEVLQTLNKQQPGAGHHLCFTQSTPPGEAEYFKGGGLMRNIRKSVKRHKMCNSPVSQPPTPITPAGLILTKTVGILPPAKVLAENKSYTQGRFSQHTQGGPKVHGLENYQQINSFP